MEGFLEVSVSSRGRHSARLAVVAVGAVALLVAACGGPATSSSKAAAADPSKDKLAQVLARGTLVGYAELNYPPQSISVPGATRATSTKCQPNQITAQEVTGFDTETTKLIAQKLAVEACFVQPTWAEVTSGNWSDRFDIVYGSGAAHADGTLKAMSIQWFGTDYTTPAGAFDLSKLDQQIP